MTADIDAKFWLEARDKPSLLVSMMRALAGNAYISFEGNLKNIDLSQCREVSNTETSSLRRNTIAPRQDFAVLPLAPDTVRAIASQVLPNGRIVHDVIHVQIEKDGRLEFGAYDNFHPDCIVVGPAVPRHTLDDLLSNGVLRAIHSATPTSGDA